MYRLHTLADNLQHSELFEEFRQSHMLSRQAHMLPLRLAFQPIHSLKNQSNMKMKFLTSLLALLCAMIISTQVQAQNLKRFKQKVENKIENRVERKIDEKIDKVLDRAFEGNPNKGQQPENSPEARNSSSNNRNKDFGDATLSHPSHGQLQVDELGQVKVSRKGSYHKITGSWWTHEADIFDGFVIEIFDTKTIKSSESPSQTTFKIPSEASLKLAYDHTMPYKQAPVNDMKRAVTEAYQEYSIPTGSVTISVLNDGEIKFSYAGPGGMSGKVVAESPQFFEEDEVKKEKKQTASNDSFFGNNTGSSNNNSAKPASEYTFTTEFVNKITSNTQKETYEISYFLNANADYIGMGADMGKFSEGDVQGESLIVMDQGNVFIFVNSSGMKLLMSSTPEQESNVTGEMGDYDYTNIRKTGASKRIMGYTCYEYEMSDDQVEMKMWAAPDFDLPNWFVQQSGAVQTPIKGYIMEFHIDSPDGKMSSTTIDIKKNINKKIISSNYRKMF
jgi:hypothetical protein